VAVHVDLEAAAEVADEVDVLAEGVAAGAEQSAAEEDKGDDAGERELGDQVTAGGEEEGARAGDGGGGERSLDLGAEEAQREVCEAQAQARGGAGVGLPAAVVLIELVVCGREDRASEGAGLEALRLRPEAAEPRGGGLARGRRGGVCGGGGDERQRGGEDAAAIEETSPARPHLLVPTIAAIIWACVVADKPRDRIRAM
jgi:hypothetical protein